MYTWCTQIDLDTVSCWYAFSHCSSYLLKARWKKSCSEAAKWAGASTRTPAPNDANLLTKSTFIIRENWTTKRSGVCDSTSNGSKNGVLKKYRSCGGLNSKTIGSTFPFFGIEASGGWSKSTTSFDQGQISVSQSCPVGNPQILGLLQTPMSSCVAAQTLAKAILADRSKMAGIKPNSTVRIVDSKRAGATVGVAVNWAPAAFAAMQAAHPTPGVQQVIFTGTNSWAANNAPFWAIGSMHQYLGATAQRVAGPGGTVAALIVSYV